MRSDANAGGADEFVVRPVTAGGWDAIAGALARLLARLAVDPIP